MYHMPTDENIQNDAVVDEWKQKRTRDSWLVFLCSEMKKLVAFNDELKVEVKDLKSFNDELKIELEDLKLEIEQLKESSNKDEEIEIEIK